MATLTVEILDKRFPAVGTAPERHVLGPLRFTVDAGETVAVTGPSGCGKTTLLNIVAGLDAGFRGHIRRPQPGRIGYVFQEPRLLPWRTVADNLRLVLPGPPEEDERRIARVLAEVELTEARDVYASRLSLGMARRVAIARAFVIEPDLLLLDEPFVSLDAPTARRMRLLLLDLLAAHEPTTLFVTHDLREAVMVADRIIVLSHSPARIVADLPVRLPRDARADEEAVEEVRRSLGEIADLLAAERAPA
jgi:NitT/TauT family transport system ATP-binding protein